MNNQIVDTEVQRLLDTLNQNPKNTLLRLAVIRKLLENNKI